MHWFESKIEQLCTLAREYRELSTVKDAVGNGPPDATPHARRSRLVAAVHALVEDVSRQPGVSACLVSVDGLVLAMAGKAPDFEGLAAYTQTCLGAASQAAHGLEIGDIRQIVVVGDRQKIAIVTIGELALCILSPANTVLLSALREKVSPLARTERSAD